MCLRAGDDTTPVAYAIVNDVPLDTQQHFRKHEGIEILSYDTQGGKDFSGFDDYLGAIYEATNPLVRFGRLLEKREKRLSDGALTRSAVDSRSVMPLYHH